MEPNSQQKRLIESERGIYQVDAGAGTGKTFALVRRYAHLLIEKSLNPGDLLFITFTTSAAEEMKDRVLNLCRDQVDPLALQEAPISTFHSLCNRLLKEHGYGAPAHLGFEGRVSSSTSVLENELLEKREFRDFLEDFQENHPGHQDFFRAVHDRSSLLDLVKSLAAKGIFPDCRASDRGDWYGDGEKYLDGNEEIYRDLVEKFNQPGQGARGPTQSSLLSRAKQGWKDKCFPPDAPDFGELAGGVDGKQLDPDLLDEAAGHDRKQLKQFLHDLYSGYVRHCLRRDYLNFGFLMMFAYVLLAEDEDVRKSSQYRYVMVDEFQDTSEIQFKLTMLLAQTNNICVVGDWKQSIYSFQYASVENILRFRERLSQYKNELNRDRTRVQYSVADVQTIPLVRNYRSSQQILDFSEQALVLPGRKNEDLNEEKIRESIVSLSGERTPAQTRIRALKSEDEARAILEKIQELVSGDSHRIGESGASEPIDYGDIAVLTRSRDFGLELQEEGREAKIPVSYEGGVELFKTDPAIILLAWLRVLEDPSSPRGWSVILEQAGQRAEELSEIINTDHDSCYERCPQQFREFREQLRDLNAGSISRWLAAVARRVFDRYGFDGEIPARLVDVIYRTAEQSGFTLGDIIAYVEDCLETGATFEISGGGDDYVTVQTIHGAKGLEYPVVFLADVNTRRFPSQGGRDPVIDYREATGIRARKQFRRKPRPYVYDSWRSSLLFSLTTGEYDEERRLAYVALTRARDHLFISAESGRESPFFHNLTSNLEVEQVESPAPELTDRKVSEKSQQEFGSISSQGSVKLGVHDIMKEVEPGDAGRGKQFGLELHEFAEKYAQGLAGSPSNRDQKHVSKWLDQKLNETREVRTEESCLLPLMVEGRKVLLSGEIDLLLIDKNRAEIIDYKTDLDRRGENEYLKQLSVYYHVINKLFAEKEVTPRLFYTVNKKPDEPLDPMDKSELSDYTRQVIF